jgi:hypothetical protein
MVFPYEGDDSTLNSIIRAYDGNEYSVRETAAELETLANAGGGGSATIYGPYASNAAAISAGRVAGDLYKSTTLINGSPIILITA